MARTVLEVFLSSTAVDLKPHREAIYTRLARIEFFKCIRQEDFGTQTTETVKYCCDKARASDLSIGLIGMRRGWEPTGDNAQRSITEMEYDSAKAAGRYQFIWVSPDEFPVPGNIRESEDEHRRQLTFRKRVMGEHIVSQKGFTSPDALASEIVEQLLAHVVTGDLIKLLRPDLTQNKITPIEDQRPAIAAVVEKLAEDRDIDLLALAKNPKGINVAELEGRLVERAKAHEASGQNENKKSAEYLRHIGALAFWHDPHKALATYQKAATLDPEEPETWLDLGELQFRFTDLDAAERSFSMAVTRGTEIGNSRIESMGLTRLGWVYRSRGNLRKAEEVTTEAIRLAQASGWTGAAASGFGNLAVIHRLQDDLDQADRDQSKALALYQELVDKNGIAQCYESLANGQSRLAETTWRPWLARKALDQAEELQRKALAIHEELSNKENIARTSWNLALIYEQKRDKDRLCSNLRRARDLYREIGLYHEVAKAESRLARAACPPTEPFTKSVVISNRTSSN